MFVRVPLLVMMCSKEIKDELNADMHGFSGQERHYVEQLVLTAARDRWNQDFSVENARTVYDVLKEAFLDICREKINLIRNGTVKCPRPRPLPVSLAYLENRAFQFEENCDFSIDFMNFLR